MKYYIYTCSEEEKPKRNGHTHRTVCVYSVIKNKTKFIGSESDTFTGYEQLVHTCLFNNGKLKLSNLSKSFWELECAGIMDVHCIN